jgi:hypothetical protein
MKKRLLAFCLLSSLLLFSKNNKLSANAANELVKSGTFETVSGDSSLGLSSYAYFQAQPSTLSSGLSNQEYVLHLIPNNKTLYGLYDQYKNNSKDLVFAYFSSGGTTSAVLAKRLSNGTIQKSDYNENGVSENNWNDIVVYNDHVEIYFNPHNLSSYRGNVNLLAGVFTGTTEYKYEIYEKAEDIKKPVFNGETLYFLSDYDSPKSVDEIKSMIKAYDDVDGDITESIYISDNEYHDTSKNIDNRKVLGEHSIKFAVKDSSDNIAEITIIVCVKDIAKPIITGPDTIKAEAGVLLSEEEILSKFTVNDNVDGNITDKLTIKGDYYSENFKKLGKYNYEITVTDNQGNIATKAILIDVDDTTKPVFSGPTTISTTTTTTTTLEEIKDKLTLTDSLDGNITSEITVKNDTFTGNEKRPGTYTITFIGSDNKGNQAEHTITVIVSDEELPYFEVDGYFLNVSTYDNLTQEQIISILTSLGHLNGNELTVLLNEYEGNESKPGLYKLKIKQDDQVYLFQIKVNESNTNINNNSNNNLLNTTNICIALLGISVVFTFVLSVKKRKKTVKE